MYLPRMHHLGCERVYKARFSVGSYWRSLVVRCDEIGMTVSNEMIMEGSVHHLSHASFFFQMKLGMKIFWKTSNLFKMWG